MISSPVLVFLSQNIHNQYPSAHKGVDAPCRSHSAVKHRNKEYEYSGALVPIGVKPRRDGSLRTLVFVARFSCGMTTQRSSRRDQRAQ